MVVQKAPNIGIKYVEKIMSAKNCGFGFWHWSTLDEKEPNSKWKKVTASWTFYEQEAGWESCSKDTFSNPSSEVGKE